MKCLLCNQQFNQEDQLKRHYINFHNVDSNNHFFMKLFKQLSKGLYVINNYVLMIF